MIRFALAFALAAAACSGGSSTTKPGPGPDPGSGSAVDPVDPSSGGGSADPSQAGATGRIGQGCNPDDTCVEGTCVKYYGIAGPRGPEFKSCEIKCDGGAACPGDKKCIAIADGPGMVCR